MDFREPLREIDRRFDALTFQQVRQVLLRAALVEAPDVVDSALCHVSLLQCPGEYRSDGHFAVHEGEQLLKHRKKRTTQLSRLKRLFSHKREQSAEPTMSGLRAQWTSQAHEVATSMNTNERTYMN